MATTIDASVALKWVVPEHGSQEASDLVANEVLVAPDLLLIECANALWAMACRKQLTPANAEAALAAIEATPIRVVPSRAHVTTAQAIAFELDQPAYDCLYLATALAERAILVTADAAFVRAVSAHPAYSAVIKALTP